MKTFAVLVVAVCVVSACGDDSGSAADASTACSFWTDADDIAEPAIYTPRWAFEPWISKDISDAQDTRDFVAGFFDRDIPVGAVVIDSPWESHYNTFVPSSSRYPGFEDLVDELHAQDIRVVMWMTQMVNESSVDFEPGGDMYEGPSPNYAEGDECGFFVNESDGYLWWKGVGAGVDFFNQDAVAWWRRQQDHVLDMGIDGWKLDFGDQYIPPPTVYTAAGPVDHQDYSEAYYREMLSYGVHRRGSEFVTMVRPYDESYGFPGRFYARPEHAPVGWVGDNRRDWFGLIDALDHMFRSADEGYVVIGSDVGGYLDFNDIDRTETFPFDTLVFARWTAVGALTPFFQLHGRANITPWTVPDNVDLTVELYRYWSILHSELVPFWYSLAQGAYAGGAPLMRTIGELDDWADDWRFQIGEAFLVAPIFDDTGVRDVALPAGARWYDWWQPQADAFDGGTTIADYDATDRRRVPLFIREGAIIPAKVWNDVTGLGTVAHADLLTVAVYPGSTASTFSLHDEDDAITTIDATATSVTISRTVRGTVLKVRADVMPVSVSVDGSPASEHATRGEFDAAASGWLADPTNRAIWIKLPMSTDTTAVAWTVP
jgi:alpha-glucosidase (family GH31 glycosyl hydrolase)